MTTFLILLAVLVLADAVSLARGLRSGATRKPPKRVEDWGTPSLPTHPFATS